MRPTWHGQTEQLVLLRLVNMPSAMTLHSEQFNLSWNVMGGLFSSFNLAQLSCTAGLQFLLLRISLYQQMTTFSHTGPKWSSSVLPVFFPGGSVRFLKNTIFQKSSRQWVRVPGHDMGPGIKYHTKKGPVFFSWKLPDVQWQEINFCLLWLRGVDLSVCVCKASGNQSWMTLIMGKFVEFPRLVARNLKVDGSNGSLLEHI